MEHETFWTLLKDAAHWEFELFLILLFDGLIGALLWPRLKRWTKHHKSDDDKLDDLEENLNEIRAAMGLDPFTNERNEGHDSPERRYRSDVHPRG
jgi:hypothetical protein